MISHLQKSFLEQLHSECDLNEAAANAIRSLKGFTPGSSPGSPPTISSGEFAIFDEEDRTGALEKGSDGEEVLHFCS